MIWICIRKSLFPRELMDWSTNKVSINLIVMPNITFVRWGIKIFKASFANTVWWWQFGWREKWPRHSIRRFGWDVKINSIHEEEFPVRWVSSLNNCCKPSLGLTASICKPSQDVVYLYLLYACINLIPVSGFCIKISNDNN